MAKDLNAAEWIFVAEYLTHGNQTQAVIASGYSGHFAHNAGYEMMKKPHVRAEIKRAQDEQRMTASLSIADVVQDIENVMKADPRDLVSYVTGSCRYCWGVDHRYHRTRGEMRRAFEDWERNDDPTKPPFDIQGGEGFNAYRDPNPDCPECCGHGVQREQLKDTRLLSPETAALFDGLEVTRHGIKIKLRSKDAAREAAARLLGLNKDTVNVTVSKKLEDFTDEELIEAMKKGTGK